MVMAKVLLITVLFLTACQGERSAVTASRTTGKDIGVNAPLPTKEAVKADSDANLRGWTERAAAHSEAALSKVKSVAPEHRDHSQYKLIKAQIEEITTDLMIRREPTWRFRLEPGWVRTKAAITAALRTRPELLLDEIFLSLALDLMNATEPYEKGAGCLLGEFLVQITEPPSKAQTIREHIVNGVLVNIQLTSRPDLTRQLIGTLDRLAPNQHPSIFIQAITNTENTQVRREALKFLARCSTDPGRCGLNADTLMALAEIVGPTPAFNELVRTAGKLRLGPVPTWCLGKLNDGSLGRACRTALSHAGTPEAFDALHAFVLEQHRRPASRTPDSYGFRDDFALILPYADTEYAKVRFYALLASVLGETRRSPYATAGIAKHLSTLGDRAKSRTLAEIHLNRYQALWPTPQRTKAQSFLISVFDAQLKEMKQPHP